MVCYPRPTESVSAFYKILRYLDLIKFKKPFTKRAQVFHEPAVVPLPQTFHNLRTVFNSQKEIFSLFCVSACFRTTLQTVGGAVVKNKEHAQWQLCLPSRGPCQKIFLVGFTLFHVSLWVLNDSILISFCTFPFLPTLGDYYKSNHTTCLWQGTFYRCHFCIKRGVQSHTGQGSHQLLSPGFIPLGLISLICDTGLLK